MINRIGRFPLIVGAVFAVIAIVFAIYTVVDSTQADEGDATDQSAEQASPTPATIKHDPDEFADVNTDNIPDLPFPHEQDPLECGIPQPWGDDNQAWLYGVWEDELIRPEVFLYESHARKEILGQAEHGSEVEVLMYQANPVLDFYLVRVVEGGSGERQGWVPEPFLTFDASKLSNTPDSVDISLNSES
jgi:hypothetical protein